MDFTMKNILLKTFGWSLAIIACLVFTSAGMPVEEADNTPYNKWELLGTRKVNYGLDRDVINVTLRDGLFTAVKLKTLRGGINMHKMVIHFKNGEQQTVALKKNFRAGDSSRVIDLKGGKRVIQKVVFWYDTKNIKRRRGTVQLWGRH
jgi:hypothetical protein